MRILFFLDCPNPYPGAGWTRIGFFSDAWSKKGHSVEVVGSFSYKTFQMKGLKKVGNVNAFNIFFSLGLAHPSIFLLNCAFSFFVSMLFMFTRRPNVAIVSFPSGEAGLGALIACKALRIKYAVDYRDEWEDYTISLIESKSQKLFYATVKKFAACLYSKSSLVTAVTSKFVDSLKLRGVTNATLVPNGADVRVFKAYDKKEARCKIGIGVDEFVIVYCGTGGAYYKLEVVIRALAKLDPHTREITRLLLVGSNPDFSNLVNLAENLSLKQNVKYIGEINDKNELSRILSAADVGLIPGLYSLGQLPVKVFEYCSCGIPVIATISEESLLAELIKEYALGAVCPPQDDEKLAKALHQLYADNSFREAAGKRARTFIEEKLDRNKIAEEFLDLIKALA
jgi:glycosyltransferase involved in cell wall biosynthesis